MERAKKVAGYLSSVAGHIANGLDVRTDEEIKDILKICNACTLDGKPLFVNGKCKICGCNVNMSENAFANKSRMVSAHCPINKW